MADITTRAEFVQYCLRRLGSPVINIEVATEQIEDRVDDAIKYWNRYHMEGSEKDYYAHTVDQATIDSKEITLPNDVLEVQRIVPVSNIAYSGLVSYEYQEALNSFNNRTSFDSVSYYIRRSNWDLISRLMSEGETISFNKYKNRVRLDMDVASLYAVGDTIILEVQKAVDPETDTEAWNDEVLQRYATALIKRQWGENTKKFGNVELPSGITINGKEIFEEAELEKSKIEDEIRDTYSLPPMFVMG